MILRECIPVSVQNWGYLFSMIEYSLKTRVVYIKVLFLLCSKLKSLACSHEFNSQYLCYIFRNKQCFPGREASHRYMILFISACFSSLSRCRVYKYFVFRKLERLQHSPKSSFQSKVHLIQLGKQAALRSL